MINASTKIDITSYYLVFNLKMVCQRKNSQKPETYCFSLEISGVVPTGMPLVDFRSVLGPCLH